MTREEEFIRAARDLAENICDSLPQEVTTLEDAGEVMFVLGDHYIALIKAFIKLTAES